jgi:hypothetical protein
MLSRYLSLGSCSLLVLVFLSGCGEKKVVPKGKVSGVVTLNGKPVEEGSVTLFSSQTGTGGTGMLGEGGRYEIERPLEYNTYEVIVIGPQSEPGGPPAKPSEIPLKYSQSKTSGLVYVVDKDANEFNIDLKK